MQIELIVARSGIPLSPIDAPAVRGGEGLTSIEERLNRNIDRERKLG
jgi:hypothetical protein